MHSHTLVLTQPAILCLKSACSEVDALIDSPAGEHEGLLSAGVLAGAVVYAQHDVNFSGIGYFWVACELPLMASQAVLVVATLGG